MEWDGGRGKGRVDIFPYYSFPVTENGDRDGKDWTGERRLWRGMRADQRNEERWEGALKKIKRQVKEREGRGGGVRGEVLIQSKRNN